MTDIPYWRGSLPGGNFERRRMLFIVFMYAIDETQPLLLNQTYGKRKFKIWKVSQKQTSNKSKINHLRLSGRVKVLKIHRPIAQHVWKIREMFPNSFEDFRHIGRRRKCKILQNKATVPEEQKQGKWHITSTMLWHRLPLLLLDGVTTILLLSSSSKPMWID